MRMTAEVAGLRELQRNFARIEGAARQEMADALDDGAHALRDDIVKSILHDPKTGKVYTHHMIMKGGRLVKGRERATPHQASAPGETPASDTGFLVGHIVADNTLDELEVAVVSEARYSEELEYGRMGGRYPMEPRPFMRPGLQRMAGRIVDLVRGGLARAVRRSGR